MIKVSGEEDFPDAESPAGAQRAEQSTYSYRTGCQMPSHPLVQARGLSGRPATLSE